MQKFPRTGHIGMDAATKLARRSSLGGSDARIIMSGNQADVEALWREKRGEDPDLDLSEILFIQLGNITEAFNLDWFQLQTDFVVTDEQAKIYHPHWPRAHATLDGIVRDDPTSKPLGVIEAKFMLPFNWTLEDAVDKYFPQVQHQLMITGYDRGWLSVITGGGQWKKAEIEADIFYQVKLLQAEQDFWDCVETGRTPTAQVVNQPDRVVATRVVDMTGNNEWASIAFEVRQTVEASKKHDSSKRRLKKLFGDDMAKASGHGVTIRRGKDGRALWTIDNPESLPEAA